MMQEDQEQQTTPETSETASPEVVAETSAEVEIESTDAVDTAQDKNPSEANEEVKAVEAEEDHEAPKDKKIGHPRF